MNSIFAHPHQVQFYETDLMGIVHHSNYLRWMEEARVAWAHSKGLIDYQQPHSAAHFAVLETQVRHLRPALFGDWVDVLVQARLFKKARVQFQYLVRNRQQNHLAVGTTTHVALDEKLQPMRLPSSITLILEKETWTETWPSNL